MTNACFSVAMCVYGGDRPDWFDAAMQSVVEQTMPPSEIVLVVDGPIPDSLDNVILKYQNQLADSEETRFIVDRLETNQGHGNARRRSLDLCTNELVALMDADDICVSNRFEQQLAMFAGRPALDIVGGDIAEFIGEENNIVGHRTLPTTDAEIRADMMKECAFNQMTVMFRKSAVFAAGNYVDWYCNEDYYLWIRMMQNGAVFANTGTVLVNMRVGADMYRRRGGIKYYKSGARLQKYMYHNKIINFGQYFCNCTKRFIVQVLLPNHLRGWVFRKFARTQRK